ncbi:MAG TPA: PSD1 and planctomycete cytochrome C domain-containing protein [Bryobacteraceae bacterium]|nr:PSD1 and planctomycete cytochrome C domain-containing protein [Bryobacteraceae bacterium]
MIRKSLAVAAVMTAMRIGAAQEVEFSRDVRPILSDRCFLCHGPDEANRKVDLRLDTEAGAKHSRGKTTPIVPGDPAASEVYRRISADNAGQRMPPSYAGHKPLSAREIATIRRWIEQGARWQTHWAFITPRRPEPPAVSRRNWARNPIDRFILARLEREGLQPSPEADPTLLLRRVTLDLTGLPPSPAELDAFLADRSPDAYEKVVDRLLASPHYGERMALDWLDAARYADTHGYQVDPEREMWPWRDWVIRAFNDNLPFDQFTIQQLAGDLLPDATLDQKIATGFNRNHRVNTEAGSIPEEFHVENIVDRIGTTGSVWLGLTVGCARCHDHKYDPLTMKDFYSMFAFFNNVPEIGTGGPRDARGNLAPSVRLPRPALEAQIAGIEEKIESAQAELKKVEARLAPGMAEWEKTFLSSAPDWEPLEPARISSDRGVTFNVKEDRSVLVSGEHPDKDVYTITAETRLPKVTAFRLELLPDPSLPGGGSGRGAGGKSMLTLFEARMEPLGGGKSKSVDLATITPSATGAGAVPIQALKSRAQLRRGWFVDDVTRPEFAVIEPPATLDLKEGARFTFKLGNEYGDGQLIGRFRLSVTGAEFPEPVSDEIRKLITAGPDARKPKEERTLRTYYLRHLRERRLWGDKVAKLQTEKRAIVAKIPSTMVMSDMEEPRDTFLLFRGDYQKHGEKVTAAVPSFLPPLPEGAPHNRLGFAQWLVAPSNPLTARVAVNRYWQSYFGTGLVKTADDFGSQGEPPSHPELLDWLATEFIRSGWDVKAMQKAIVMSATYRQSSRTTPQIRERDPENRLLARGPRFRLPAEVIRDQALAVAGVLTAKLGGPPVKPYQPDGLWEQLSVIENKKLYVLSKGDDLWRRSVYTYWKRTAPPPAMVTFDAPTREYCVVRRGRSSTPLQALVLLNDETFTEAARRLAERMIHEGGDEPSKRIAAGFRLAASREPRPSEIDVLRAGLERRLTAYQHDPDAAARLLSTGQAPRDESLDTAELAAYTTVASVILNLDEVITKQ